MTLNLKTGKDFDIEDENSMPFYSKGIIDPTITAQIQGNPKGLRFLVDSKGRLWSPASMLTSPQNPTNQYSEIATVEPFYSGGNTPQPGVVTHSYIYAVSQSGSNVTPLIVAAYQDANFGNNLALAVDEVIGFYRNGVGFFGRLGAYGYSNTSAANTAQTVTIDKRDLHTVISIYMTCSGGGPTLQVLVSDDGLTNWILCDNFVAAGSRIVVYSATVLATTITVAPTAYQFIKINVGSAGVSNTTTLDVAIE